jgi:hypothetical protein
VPSKPLLPVLKVVRGSSAQAIADKLSRTASDIVKILFGLGEMVTATQSLSDDMIEMFASELGISRATLESAAVDAENSYAPFPKQPKTRPFQKKFKPSKERIIDNPVGVLRTIQRRIHQRLLASLDLPFYLCGGVKGRSLLDNVTMHLGAPVLVGGRLIVVDSRDQRVLLGEGWEGLRSVRERRQEWPADAGLHCWWWPCWSVWQPRRTQWLGREARASRRTRSTSEHS